MDKVLAPMLGRNVQAYVDDMVVTSLEKSKHVSDLEELFTTIAKFRLKLNPKKCIFGVEAGKFLGYLLTERGIEANPDIGDEEPGYREGSAAAYRSDGRPVSFCIS